MITVGDVTGTVTHMHIRATTVTDFDCRELIVPNKDFITGRVINWTLSDRLVRLTLPVPVAPDADLKATERILLETSRANPHVLKSPPPSVMLADLATAAAPLKFELHVFVRGPRTDDSPATLLQAQADQVRHETEYGY